LTTTLVMGRSPQLKVQATGSHPPGFTDLTPCPACVVSEITSSHSSGREPLLKPCAYLPSVEFAQAADGSNSLLFSARDEAGEAVIHTSRTDRNARPACQCIGFDHHEPERFRPGDRKQQSRGASPRREVSPVRCIQLLMWLPPHPFRLSVATRSMQGRSTWVRQVGWALGG
jgi:hypothetical protein